MKVKQPFQQTSNIALFHGDCVKMLRNIPDAFSQLVVTSPPYNAGKEPEQHLTIDDYLTLQQPVIEECVTITWRDGSIC